VILLKWDIEYKDEVSNSHCSPIHGSNNFCNHNKKLPRHYKGWQGRVWMFFSSEPEEFTDNYMGHSLIHTGSGGYGLYNIACFVNSFVSHPKNLSYNRSGEWEYKGQYIYPLSFDCKIFIDDIPGYKLEMLLNEKGPDLHDIRTYEKPYNKETIFGRSDKFDSGEISRPTY
jgi:hypothetical protein